MGSYAPRQEVTLVVVVVSTICFSIICCEDATRVCSRSPAPSQILYQSNDVIPESRCKSPNRSGQPDTTTRYQRLDQTPRGRKPTRRKAHLCILHTIPIPEVGRKAKSRQQQQPKSAEAESAERSEKQVKLITTSWRRSSILEVKIEAKASYAQRMPLPRSSVLEEPHV